MQSYEIPFQISGVCCNIEYPVETHFKQKSCKILFAHELFLSYPITLNFCTEHGSGTAVLCAKFQNDLAKERVVMNAWDFTRFTFRKDALYCNGSFCAG